MSAFSRFSMSIVAIMRRYCAFFFFKKQSFISWCLHCYNGQKVLRSNQISKLPVLAARMWSSLSGTVEQQV